MSRYLIPILLVVLVLLSGLPIGCQKQPQEDLESLLGYLDEVDPIMGEYLQMMLSVTKSDKAIIDAVEYGDMGEIVEAITAHKNNVNHALQCVDSGLLILEGLRPPIEAQDFHRLMIESLEKAQDGLLRWFYAVGVLYEVVCTRSMDMSTAPSVSEDEKKARQLLREAQEIWTEVQKEFDDLIQILEERAKD